MRGQRGIFERPPASGRWWICYFDECGCRHREKVGSKSAAIAAYQKRKNEIRERRFFPEKLRRREITFEEIARDALEYVRARNASGSFKPGRLAAVLSWFGNRPATQIMPQEIERKLNELAEAGRSPATVNRYRAVLSMIYSLANRNSKLAVNPARLVRLRKENNARVRFLDEMEEAALRAKIRELYPEREPEFDVALHTGMRWSEQYGLIWKNVDLKLGLLTIPRSKVGERRYLPINSVTNSALEHLRKLGNGTDRVCPNTTNKKHRLWWGESIRAARIQDFHWHDLRHTFASRLVMAGVDLRTVQELMGHKTIAMTIRYAHLAPTHLREAVDRLVVHPTATKTATSPVGRVGSQAHENVQVQ